MDKNPDKELSSDFQNIINEFSTRNLSMILCSEPIMKSNFLNVIIDSIDIPVIFLDFDLLYTGYLVSAMIPKKNKVIIYQLEKNNLRKKISEVLTKISKEKCVVILDSFNGLHSIFAELESSIFLNSILMLLASMAQQANSTVLVSVMARKSDEGWILSPGGRHVIESKKLGKYQLTLENNSFILKSSNTNSIFKLKSLN